jgi:hypothetical protein
MALAALAVGRLEAHRGEHCAVGEVELDPRIALAQGDLEDLCPLQSTPSKHVDDGHAVLIRSNAWARQHVEQCGHDQAKHDEADPVEKTEAPAASRQRDRENDREGDDDRRRAVGHEASSPRAPRDGQSAYRRPVRAHDGQAFTAGRRGCRSR